MAKVIRLKRKEPQKIQLDSPALPSQILSPAEYHAILKKDPLNQKAYNRLMIHYRKLKEYKKELSLIQSAIKSFESFFKSQKKKKAKTVEVISSKLNRSLGLIDKKGNYTYDHEPVASWKKRKEVVLKKIKA